VDCQITLFPRCSSSEQFFNEKKSNLPDGAFVLAHTADILRQVERVGVPKRGWIGGVSWFGSVLSFGLHSSWVMRWNRIMAFSQK